MKLCSHRMFRHIDLRGGEGGGGREERVREEERRRDREREGRKQGREEGNASYVILL